MVMDAPSVVLVRSSVPVMVMVCCVAKVCVGPEAKSMLMAVPVVSASAWATAQDKLPAPLLVALVTV